MISPEGRFFHMSFFKKHVFFCNQVRPEGHPAGCCAASGGNDIGKQLWERVGELELEGVKINSAGCLGRCDQGPVVVVYPEGVWYSPKTSDDVEEIIQSHLIKDEVVERIKV
jgi:(2Fe-2S) ferredoxin